MSDEENGRGNCLSIQRVESTSVYDATTITTTDTSGYADSMRLNQPHPQEKKSMKSSTSRLLAMCFTRKSKTATVGIGNTCHPYHKRGNSTTTNNNNKHITTAKTINQVNNNERHHRPPPVHGDDHSHHRRCSDSCVISSKTEDILEDATEAGTDEPDPLNSLDSRTMLESLGDDPTSDELASIAALRAKEYIAECLSTEVSSVVLDRHLWESIPQFTKMDLIVGQHLGKGTFSDVFEVIASIVEDDEPPTRKSLDLDSANLDKLINKKFHSQQESEDPNSTLNNHGEKNEKPQFDNQDVNSDEETLQPDSVNHKRVPRRHTAEDIARSSIVILGTSNNNPTRTYQTLAMKCLRPQTRSNMDQFMIGVEDLVNETAMLASLSHPNIIKLHGRAGGCTTNSFRLSDGFFILLDRLRDTLDDRIRSWKKTSSSANKKVSSPSTSQIKTACSIADAMSYLHSKNIVFRDLKPSNVGFDSNGVVKLFDFGFAVHVDDHSNPPRSSSSLEGSSDKYENNGEETHQLLYERCGTIRYMAPEVGLDIGYSLPADVYSYGILLWEICSLKKPFDNIKSPIEFENKVFKKGARPKLAKEWSNSLRDVLTSCWLATANDRPTMLEVKTKMHQHAQAREVTSTTAQLKKSGIDNTGKGSLFKKLTRTASLY